jgi:predicted dehydrogenase
MPEALRVAVVGVGYLGRFHAKIYSELEGVELVTVVDSDPERARAVAEEYGCAWTTDAAELHGAIDAVSVVVPTRDHLEVARPLLEAGIHMLLEKPIARTTEEAEELVRLADAAGVLLQIGHVERYNAGVMALAEHVREPRFIEAHRIGGFPARATDVDVVTDLMIHDIDIILSLVGAPIRSVSAVGLPVITEHVDIANARLEFEDGCIANVTASRVSNQTLVASASSRRTATRHSISSSRRARWCAPCAMPTRSGRRSCASRSASSHASRPMPSWPTSPSRCARVARRWSTVAPGSRHCASPS